MDSRLAVEVCSLRFWEEGGSEFLNLDVATERVGIVLWLWFDTAGWRASSSYSWRDLREGDDEQDG